MAQALQDLQMNICGTIAVMGSLDTVQDDRKEA